MPSLNPLGQPIGDPVAGSFPRPRPPGTAMVGRYCSIEPIRAEHAPALHAAFTEDTTNGIWTYLAAGPFASLDDYRPWVDAMATSQDPLMHTILVNGEPLGHAAYLRIDPGMGVVEMGWINLSPRLQRTRAATEFQFLMMARAFDELGYRRYEWKCDDLNAPSIRAAKRLGFRYEGTFRQAIHYKGRNRDTAWFSILDIEWPAIRAEFVRWLDPDNFDAKGVQKTPLAIGTGS